MSLHRQIPENGPLQIICGLITDQVGRMIFGESLGLFLSSLFLVGNRLKSVFRGVPILREVFFRGKTVHFQVFGPVNGRSFSCRLESLDFDSLFRRDAILFRMSSGFLFFHCNFQLAGIGIIKTKFKQGKSFLPDFITIRNFTSFFGNLYFPFGKMLFQTPEIHLRDRLFEVFEPVFAGPEVWIGSVIQCITAFVDPAVDLFLAIIFVHTPEDFFFRFAVRLDCHRFLVFQNGQILLKKFARFFLRHGQRTDIGKCRMADQLQLIQKTGLFGSHHGLSHLFFFRLNLDFCLVLRLVSALELSVC